MPLFGKWKWKWWKKEYNRPKKINTHQIEYEKIGDEGAREIADKMETTKHTALHLKCAEIGADGATAIAGALGKNATLIELDLQYNRIGHEGARAFADALVMNRTLKRLNLTSNNISHGGASALASALERNTTLRRLILTSNEISDKGASTLASALERNTSALTYLDLSWNDIESEGARALADALEKNSTLVELILDYNKIKAEGTIALANALKKNITLTDLGLAGYGIEIGDEGARAFADALQTNTVLTNLDYYSNSMYNNNIGDEARARIRILLDRNKTKGEEWQAVVNANAAVEAKKEAAETKKKVEEQEKTGIIEVEAEAKKKDEEEKEKWEAEAEKEATLYGVEMFESGKLDFQTNDQSRISLIMSSFREVDENEHAIGTITSLKESKFDLHVDEDTELLKIFGDSKPSADDSGIAKGTHSYMETCIKARPDHKYLLKVNAHQVTAPGKAGTKIENIDLVRGDFMVTVELSKDASGSQAADGYIEFKIEMHTSGSGIRKIPGLEFAYYLGEGIQMDLTNRYFESLDNSDEFEERFMPEGFPTLELDANNDSKCFILLRFQQFGGSGRIFYDPWWGSVSNRDGKFRVYSTRDYPDRFPIPVNFGAKHPKVPLDIPIVNVIDGARRRIYPRELPLKDFHYLIVFKGKEMEEFTADQAYLTIMDLFDRIFFVGFNLRQNRIVFDVDISRLPPKDGEEDEKRKGEEEAEEAKLTVVPIIAPENCKIMISFNDYSAGEDAEKLANYLTGNGHDTFCTRLYCPKNPGSWRIPTKEGVKNCKYFIMLMTNGWQKSSECRDETNMAINRSVRKDGDDEEGKLVFIPVWYEDFDFDFDGRTGGEDYELRFSSIQAIYHNTSDNWMEKILDLLV